VLPGWTLAALRHGRLLPAYTWEEGVVPGAGPANPARARIPWRGGEREVGRPGLTSLAAILLGHDRDRTRRRSESVKSKNETDSVPPIPPSWGRSHTTVTTVFCAMRHVHRPNASITA
jgi:hypothetical protein